MRCPRRSFLRSRFTADVVRNAAFRDEDIARIRGQWLAVSRRKKPNRADLPCARCRRCFTATVIAYAIPFTGSAPSRRSTSLSANDLRKYVGDFLRPDNAKILVAGDTTLDAIIPQLDAVFGDWTSPSTTAREDESRRRAAPPKPRVFLMDVPGSQQSLILAGVVAPSTKAKNNLEIQTMSGAFGGTFTSRLNMNLREDKHWAYGAFSFLTERARPAAFHDVCAGANRQDRRTGRRSFCGSEGRVGSKPLTDEEIDQDQNRRLCAHARRISRRPAPCSAR